MGHYLLNFLFATGGMIFLLYGAFFYLKKNPQLTGSSPLAINPKSPLHVESMIELEPRKRLYVVGYGQERFLISTTVDKTEFLTTLQTEQPFETEMASISAPVLSVTNTQASYQQPETLWERFGLSLKMVFHDRLTHLGGK